jgi:hypothetical protein
MIKNKKFLIRNYLFVIVFIMLVMPALSLAQTATSTSSGLVPCTTNCGFNDLMTLVNTVIHFLLFDMAIPIAAIMFVYAGFELVTSGGSTEKRGLAKKVFTNTAIGLILAFACWIIIYSVLHIMGYNGAWIGF